MSIKASIQLFWLKDDMQALDIFINLKSSDASTGSDTSIPLSIL